MFVRENMTKDPVCITPESTITQGRGPDERKRAASSAGGERQAHRRSVVTEGVISSSGASKATSLSIYELNYLLSQDDRGYGDDQKRHHDQRERPDGGCSDDDAEERQSAVCRS